MSGPEFLIAGVAIVLAVGAVITYHLLNRPDRLIRNAALKRASGKAAQAAELYLRALGRLESSPSPAHKQDIGIALNALGDMAREAGQADAAFEYYARAHAVAAPLRAEATGCLAEGLARRKARGDDHVATYLLAIEHGVASDAVIALMQGLCQVSEDMAPAARAAAAALNRRVIAAKPDIEWAHYFLGLAQLLTGRMSEAAASLSVARALNNDRALTHYWLCLALFELSGETSGEAVDALAAPASAFLHFPATTARARQRAAQIAGEVGRRYISAAGGFAHPPVELPLAAKEMSRKAMAFFQRAVELLPDDAAAHHQLGQAAWNAGDAELSRASLEEAARLAPANARYAYSLALSLNHAGSTQQAVRALASALALEPKIDGGHALLGRLLVDCGDIHAARPHLEAALAFDDGDMRVRADLIKVLYRLEDYAGVAGAAAPFQADPDLVPDGEATLLPVARSLVRLCRFSEARECLSHIADSPDAGYYLACAQARGGDIQNALAGFERLAGITGGAHVLDAQLQSALARLSVGESEAARATYERVLADSPANFQALRGLAVLCYEAGNWAEAVTHFSEALECKPGDATTRFALALSLERQGSLDAALDHYQQLIASSPFSSAVTLRSGILRCRLGQYEAARNLLDQCRPRGRQPAASGEIPGGGTVDFECAWLYYRGLASARTGALESAIVDWAMLSSRHPSDNSLVECLAGLYDHLAIREAAELRWASAVQAWKVSLRLRPSSVEAGKRLARAHYQLAIGCLHSAAPPDFNRAVKHLKDALGASSEDTASRYLLALCLLQQGRPAECQSELEALLNTEGQSPRLLYHMAIAHLQRGDTEAAIPLLKSLLDSGAAQEYRDYAAWALANENCRAGDIEAALELSRPTGITPDTLTPGVAV